MKIPKIKHDENGLEFEISLFKAMYIYPKPDRQDRQGVFSHALNIYEGEEFNRSLCDYCPELFKPFTYKNVQDYFPFHKKLQEQKDRTITKNRFRKTPMGTWEEYNEVKKVKEFVYMFQDVFHIPTCSIIELKKYETDSGRSNHLNKIRAKRKMMIADYYFIARECETHFEITDCLSLNDNGQFQRHNIEEKFQKS
jgi:hypothetical protein